MANLSVTITGSDDELLQRRSIELEHCLEQLFPDRELKLVRTITRDRLFYLVDSRNGQVTTVVIDVDGSLRVRYPTGMTGEKLDDLVTAEHFASIA